MAQDHGLCRKRVTSQNGPGARAATAGPCCSCQQDSLAACKHDVAWDDDPGAHGMNRGKQSKMTGRGQEHVKGSGHGRQRVDRHTACRTATAGGHSRRTLRPAQASTTTASRWPASQRNNSCRQSWPASRRAVQVDGGSAVVLALNRRAQTYLTCLYPTYRLCHTHCPPQ